MEVRDFVPQDQREYIEMSNSFYNMGAALSNVPEEHFKRTFDLVVGRSPYARGLMIQKEGVTAGYALLSFSWSNEAGGIVVWLEELYIKEAFRSEKLGTSFLQWLDTEYIGKVGSIKLEVAPSNAAAQKLYERCGYHVLNYIEMIKT